MINSPCFNCKNRKLNCHSTCTDYIAYHLYNDHRNKVIHKNKMKDVDFTDFKTRVVHKEKKRKGVINKE